MQYKQLGRTGLMVSELCLGTMTFGGDAVFSVMGSVQQPEADQLIGRALDAGVNFIDTANVYSRGRAETITGQAIRNLGIQRSGLVLATKAYAGMGPGPNDRGASRGHLMDAVHASLKRLGTDYIDLYQLHGFDTVTPVEETMRALDDLVTQGKVRYVGCCNARAWQMVKANAAAERLGQVRFESLQAYYSVAGRDLEREITPMLADQQLGLLVWSPLAGGLLAGQVTRNDAATEGTRRAKLDFPPVDAGRAWACIDAMRLIAQTHQASVAQVALAWLLHQQAVTSVIVGVKRLDQLNDNLGAVALKLSADELATLNGVSALPPEYPAWMADTWVASERFAPVPPPKP